MLHISQGCDHPNSTKREYAVIINSLLKHNAEEALLYDKINLHSQIELSELNYLWVYQLYSF